MYFFIDPQFVSFLSLTGVILCILSIRKMNRMVRSSAILMFQVGMCILAPALLAFAYLYYYISTTSMTHESAQFIIRFILLYLFGGINIWQIILLIWGKNL